MDWESAGAVIRRYMRVILDWNCVIARKIKRSEGLSGEKASGRREQRSRRLCRTTLLPLKTPGPGQLEVPKKIRALVLQKGTKREAASKGVTGGRVSVGLGELGGKRREQEGGPSRLALP